MRKGEVWAPTSRVAMPYLVLVHDVSDGEVSYAPHGGGLMALLPIKDFEQKFDRVSTDRLVELQATFHRASVALHEMDEGVSVPCWTNGELVCGWDAPWFDKVDVDAAMADGRIVSRSWWQVFFHQEFRTYIEICEPSGMDLRDLDRGAAITMARENGGFCSFAYGAKPIEVTIVTKRKIVTAEGVKTVFRLGETWTWFRPDFDPGFPRMPIWYRGEY